MNFLAHVESATSSFFGLFFNELRCKPYVLSTILWCLWWLLTGLSIDERHNDMWGGNFIHTMLWQSAGVLLYKPFVHEATHSNLGPSLVLAHGLSLRPSFPRRSLMISMNDEFSIIKSYLHSLLYFAWTLVQVQIKSNGSKMTTSCYVKHIHSFITFYFLHPVFRCSRELNNCIWALE